MLLILTNQRLTFFFPSLTSHSFHSSLPTLQLGTSRKSNVRFPEFYSVLGPVNPKKQVLLCSQRQETQQLAGVEVLVRSFLMSPSMLTSTLPASMLWFFFIFFLTTLLALPLWAVVNWSSGPRVQYDIWEILIVPLALERNSLASVSVLQRQFESAWRELRCGTWRSSQTSESREIAQEPWSREYWHVKEFLSCVFAGFIAFFFSPKMSLTNLPHTKKTRYVSKIVSPRGRLHFYLFPLLIS